MKNTDKRYIITVENIQTIDGVKNTVNEKAECTYTERNNKKYILYKTEEEGIVSSSIIIVEDGVVTVRRSGAVESDMVCDLKRRTVSLYATPYGKLTLYVDTESIFSKLCDDGGELRLKYTLTIQNEKYYNDMTIKVVEKC